MLKFRTDEKTTTQRIFKVVDYAHRRKFPNVTGAEQEAKFLGEVEEVRQAKTREDKIEEWADCFISWRGLCRFFEPAHLTLKFMNILEEMTDHLPKDVTTAERQSAIVEKMFIVYRRPYINNQHVGD